MAMNQEQIEAFVIRIPALVESMLRHRDAAQAVNMPLFTVIQALKKLPNSQVDERRYSHETHQDQGEEVPVPPIRPPPKLRNAPKVHAIYARDQRRRQKYRGQNGEDSYGLAG